MSGNTVRDAGVIYSAIVSSTLTLSQAVGYVRGRKIAVRIAYGWHEEAGQLGELTVRIHNGSPSKTIYVVRIGWRQHLGNGVGGGQGDFWDTPDASLPIEPGVAQVHTFAILNPPDEVFGHAILGDQKQHTGTVFAVPSYGVSIRSADSVTFTKRIDD